jgi:hypothetical protein
MQKTPDFPQETKTKIKDEQYPKMKEVNENDGYPRLTTLWMGNIRGTASKISEYQESAKHLPVLMTQFWVFSNWENTTPQQSVFMIGEAFKYDSKMMMASKETSGILAMERAMVDHTHPDNKLVFAEEICRIEAEPYIDQKAANYGYKKPAC